MVSVNLSHERRYGGEPPRARRRPQTLSLRRLRRDNPLRVLQDDDAVDAGARPRTRADCRDVPRPCPFVSCRYHLYLDVNPQTGSVKLNFPDKAPEELAHSCCLDVAETGGASLESIGALLNVSRERARQLECAGLSALFEDGAG